jgi:hypothetical protein
VVLPHARLQDYSFMDTPQLPLQSDNSTIIPRLALPNQHIPAYINGTLVWGTQPMRIVAAPQAEMAMLAGVPAAEAQPGTGLPRGVSCTQGTNNQGQTCG